MALTEASIQFHTGQDDKDHDTALSVTVAHVGGRVYAYREKFAGDLVFPDWTKSEVFNLPVTDGNVTPAQIKDGIKLFIEIHPNGDDNWWTKWVVTLIVDGKAYHFVQKDFVYFDDDDGLDKQHFKMMPE